MTTSRPGASVRVRVREVLEGRAVARDDRLATEEPLEIRLSWPGEAVTRVVVTMRTPGADFELAAGLLFAEGLVDSHRHIAAVSYCTDPALPTSQTYNVVTVRLDRPPLRPLTSRFAAMSAACGVCGQQSLDDLDTAGLRPVVSSLVIDAGAISCLPDRLRQRQAVFGSTGGLHAAGAYDATGAEIAVREDVGRHNAVDKVVGHALLGGRGTLDDCVVCVSGRVGFEIVQKAVAAKVALIASVGAPSSLAVQTAERFGVTLVGFVRERRFVVYTEAGRLGLPAQHRP